MLEQHIKIINQVFEIEKKVAVRSDLNSINRHLSRIKESFEEIGLIYSNPIGEVFNETRTDCEATISGNSAENLKIVEVIKPIIRNKNGQMTSIIQKGIVIVEGK